MKKVYKGQNAEIKKGFRRIRKKLAGMVCLLGIIVAASCFMYLGNISALVGQITSADILLIDPGHGGFDGGAVSSGGVPEKGINLEIAMKVAELAKADGWVVVMTRDEDISLNENNNGAIRSQKTADLKKRKELIDETRPTVVVSIHLNSFAQDRSVRGAQVFYPAGSEEDPLIAASKELAETIQEQLIAGINDGTNRTVLAKKDFRLFKNVNTPTVLVECGFLSNREEAELLCSDDYQHKISSSIYSGVMKFTGKKGKEQVRIVESAYLFASHQ